MAFELILTGLARPQAKPVSALSSTFCPALCKASRVEAGEAAMAGAARARTYSGATLGRVGTSLPQPNFLCSEFGLPPTPAGA